ncbi:MAG: hypothetical protein ACJ78Q_08410 [Chloroflexia bacterium]
MFLLAEWDSPLAIVLEILLSVAVIVAIMWVARRSNLTGGPRRELPGSTGSALPMPPSEQAARAPEDEKNGPTQTGSKP